ncbi:MAG: YgjV family protein [Oscillospiraceae bacterium]|nr:YgjV family protein [Oscillospiraceae bacterium]
MEPIEIIAQTFGIVGMLFAFVSFQAKKNSWFFILQALCAVMFAVNYGLIGAVSGTLFNLAGIARGVLFQNSDRKLWKLFVVEILFLVCITVSLVFYTEGALQITLSLLTYAALATGTYVMWTGSGKNIRYVQLFFVSPAWLVYNIVNFTIGGILCESFNMISAIVSFIRYGKDGFEK